MATATKNSWTIVGSDGNHP